MANLNRFLPNQPVPVGKRQFYECGICGHMHSAAWDGDCRQDNARFTCDELDERFPGWEEVTMPDTDKATAEEAGFQVHHDYLGWYVVAPDEEHDEGGFGPDGVSLGFDGRQHYKHEDDAWAAAANEGGESEESTCAEIKAAYSKDA